MEIYVLIGFLQVVGWLYVSGIHYEAKRIVRKHGNDSDIESIDGSVWYQYVILFFIWPHYLGSCRD
jgi:hypothetical protein